jgi:hypothetical protein
MQGKRTSEFWVTVAVSVAAVVLIALGKIDDPSYLIGLILPSLGYQVSRTRVKVISAPSINPSINAIDIPDMPPPPPPNSPPPPPPPEGE